MTHHSRLCWAEIPVINLAKSKAYYSAILQQDLVDEQMGPMATAIMPSEEGSSASLHLYEGKPAPEGTGNTVNITVDDALEGVMARVTAAGGKVISPIIDIPAGQFFYTFDLDGNSVGFFKHSS